MTWTIWWHLHDLGNLQIVSMRIIEHGDEIPLRKVWNFWPSSREH